MILGLDMSTKKSGYSLFDGETLIDYGTWIMQSEQEDDWRERIIWMSNRLKKYCEQHNITQIYCEDVPPILENVDTVRKLSALQGCVLSTCNLLGIEIKFVPVPTWKNKIGVDLVHSKDAKDFYKLHKDQSLIMLKKNAKLYEKKMSIDYANKVTGAKLIYRALSSLKNEDDIADSINIVISETFEDVEKYDSEDFTSIMENLWESIRLKQKKKDFKSLD